MWDQFEKDFSDIFNDVPADLHTIRVASRMIFLSNEIGYGLEPEASNELKNKELNRLNAEERLIISDASQVLYERLRDLNDRDRLTFFNNLVLLDDHYTHFHNIGDICVILHKYKEAKEAFSRAIALDGHNFRHYNGIGRAYYYEEQYEDAIRNFLIADSLSQNDKYVWINLPLAYAIRQHLPQIEVVVFREWATNTPLDEFGSVMIRDYAKDMASEYL